MFPTDLGGFFWFRKTNEERMRKKEITMKLNSLNTHLFPFGSFILQLFFLAAFQSTFCVQSLCLRPLKFLPPSSGRSILSSRRRGKPPSSFKGFFFLGWGKVEVIFSPVAPTWIFWGGEKRQKAQERLYQMAVLTTKQARFYNPIIL